MLRGQGLKVAVISFVALLFGIATMYFQPKVNHDGPFIAGVCALFQSLLTLWACFIIARAKDLNSNWGFIGLLGLFGVGILLCIPAGKLEDKSNTESAGDEKPPSPIS
ncbi:MAG: hypothetical protein C0469_07910 [Cyanobacteria bacterium DS2.3.42]|nr:hypothetical protein [Cyanobacteria bacterium DS2.3.42]